jgi:hypothetical protein
VTDEVPADVAQRRYERWVMRAAELVHGDYPQDSRQAEQVLLGRLRNGLMSSTPPSEFPTEAESGPKEGSKGLYYSEYAEEEGSIEAARSLVFALYSALGGEEWSLVVKANEEKGTLCVSARYYGVSLDVEGAPRVELRVEPSSLACRDASDLRALHERIARNFRSGSPL